jgi:MinD-like ATPase involved in chromosome partitioning or flagellar assembly
MSANIVKPKGVLQVYAAGGGGINIASRLEKYRGRTDPGYATVSVAYLDSSKSNLHKELPADSIYLIEGKDGAGQVRREIAPEVKPLLPEILHQFKPGTLNVVLHTAGGGSGSSIGPLLAEELILRDQPVIVIMIGDASTRLHALNTLNTFKSYEHFARKTVKAPIVIAYLENTGDASRAEVDKNVEGLVEGLAVLFSRENAELDTRDLYHWLRFDKVTTFDSPMLAALTIINGDKRPEGIGSVISVATLAKPGADATFPVIPEVRYLGLLPDDLDEAVAKQSPVHFVTSDGILHEAVNRITTLLAQLTEDQGARRGPKGFLSSADKADEDSGLVL